MKQPTSTAMKTAQGFTLIEMMIVVAIIGIISTIAYASYEDSIRKTKRAEGKASLMELAQKFERCYTASGAYDGTCSVHDGTDLVAPFDTTSKGYYDIVAVFDATSFTLTATSTFDDPQCTVLNVTSTGRKTAEDDGGADSTVCW